MNRESRRKALIVGGGIGGLTAAYALLRSGWEVAVFERVPAYREVGAGLTLWTNAINALKHLDLADEVVAAGGRMRVGEVRTSDGRVLSRTHSEDHERRLGAPTICIHRSELLVILASHTPSADLTLGAACVGFTQEADGVTLALSDGRQEHGDVLIGADGLRSVVREQLLGAISPRFAGYLAWRGVTDFQSDSLPVGYSSETWGRGLRFGIVPLGRGRVYWYATENAASDTSAPPDLKARLLGRFATWHDPIRAILEATDESAILQNGIYDLDPQPVWGVGRVTLLGDAIHPTTPNLGQGACQAIEDAVVLAQCLSGEEDTVSALRIYEAKRRKRTTQITLLSRRFGQLAQADRSATCFLRDSLLRIMPRRQAQKQLDTIVGYRV